MLNTMYKDLSRRELVFQMLRWAIKTIMKIRATLNLLISTARYEQEVKEEKSPIPLAFYCPHRGRSVTTGQMGDSSLWQGSPENKGSSCCFMGLVGRVKKGKGDWKNTEFKVKMEKFFCNNE